MKDDQPFPFKPRDWVAQAQDHRRIAKVKDVSRDEDGRVLLDLWIYDVDGTRIGRESPALGGPRTFEPCCDALGWERIAKPCFPIALKWIDNGSGERVARHYAGPSLPDANWSPPVPRQARANPPTDDKLRLALEAIADGHNDPRTLAKQVLGQMS